VNLKITALHTSGTNYEKLGNFEMALQNFKMGKEYIEANFGPEHQLYAVFCSAMGGVKLRTKYNTPASQQARRKRAESQSSSSPSPDPLQEKKVKKRKKASR
jgi:hypothetical protein